MCDHKEKNITIITFNLRTDLFEYTVEEILNKLATVQVFLTETAYNQSEQRNMSFRLSLSRAVLGPFRSRTNMAAWSQTISNYS